jgi:hypothetical protein
MPLHFGSRTLDDPWFDAVFDLARAFDVPCTVHPGSAWPGWRDAARLGESSFLNSGLGYFLTDALCIFHMAHAGVFERHPEVRFCSVSSAARRRSAAGAGSAAESSETTRRNSCTSGSPFTPTTS